jgi:leader peptidase (prepilin peptidase) / N-methyltransferase
MSDPILVFSIFALLFGMMIGSFLNVVIARLPEERSIVYPGSHCPCCGNAVRAYDNIPVFSWLILLKGKCRDCHSSISSLYPTIELMTGLLALLLYRKIFVNLIDFTPGNLFAFFLYFAFISALIAESFIDIKHYIIPDSLSIYAAPVAIAGMFLLEQTDASLGITWQESVLGAFFGGGTLASVALLWWVVRRYEGMGWGDVKLLLFIGAMVGPWPALPFVFICSAFSAVLVGVPVGIIKGKGWKYALPYGPFLAFSAIVWIFHGENVFPYWIQLY